jgi:hypothetical protein
MGKRTQNTRQLNADIEPELYARLESFAADRRESKTTVIRHALVRHMDSPPPLPAARKLPRAVASEGRPRGRPRKAESV